MYENYAPDEPAMRSKLNAEKTQLAAQLREFDEATTLDAFSLALSKGNTQMAQFLLGTVYSLEDELLRIVISYLVSYA